jgi:hypothetical protein
MFPLLGSLRRLKICAALATVCIVGFLLSQQAGVELPRWQHGFNGADSSLRRGGSQYNGKRMHLLIPATSTNIHLCQLMTSAAILGYPAPVLVNWAMPEASDAYVQHLAKVQGVLDYLKSLPEEQQDDLVYMMDGFDAWFQLPADVLVKRYYDVVEKAARINEADFGAANVAQYNIKDTVLFGPDKLCWPIDDKRPACWAVPESWEAKHAFGPDTDHGIIEHNRARWLNSGTIMGPAHEMRDVFAATLDRIHANHTTDSDQFYFAEVFGDQSYERRLKKLDYDRSRMLNVTEDEELLLPPQDKYIPEFAEGERSEYFIGMDFESAIWQTVAFYDEYVTVIQHNESSRYVRETSKKINPHHHFALPEDLEGLTPLDDVLAPGDSARADMPEALHSWSTVPLATNTISKLPPPVLHFTGKKGYREMWWPRQWFYPYQEQLLARLRANGVKTTGRQRDALAGAWSFTDGRMGWIEWENGLCSQFEATLQSRQLLPIKVPEPITNSTSSAVASPKPTT